MGKGLAAPTKYEYGWFNKLTAETAWGASHILPFLDWTADGGHGVNSLTGGFTREGGDIGGGVEVIVNGGALN